VHRLVLPALPGSTDEMELALVVAEEKVVRKLLPLARNFLKAVNIQLSYERRLVAVLERRREHLLTKVLLLPYDEAGARLVPAYYFVCLGVIYNIVGLK
jgi:hypothetical protein